MLNLVYTLLVGIPLALILWTLALLAAVTIIGIPVAGVLVQLAGRVLTLPPRRR